MARPSWDEYFMNLAHLAATRSTCVRRQVGAVIVKDRMVLSTGFNDTPRGLRNCGDGGYDDCRCTCAEPMLSLPTPLGATPPGSTMKCGCILKPIPAALTPQSTTPGLG